MVTPNLRARAAYEERQRRLAGARAEVEEVQQERLDEALDTAVAYELERLAQEEAWEMRHPEPPDPYAVRVGFRLDEANRAKWLVLHMSKATPNRDEIRVEFQKRLGDD
jgi:hypothetical protein